MSRFKWLFSLLFVLSLAMVPAARVLAQGGTLHLPSLFGSGEEPEVVVAWHGQTTPSADCAGWNVTVDTVWNGYEGVITYAKSLSGQWAPGQQSVDWKVTITWYKYGDHGLILDTWTAKGTIDPPDCPEYKLNLSHVECVVEGEHAGEVEVHFVLHAPEDSNPGDLHYAYGTIERGKFTGGVWHYTAYLPEGQITIDWAFVWVKGVKVTLHNPNEYDGDYRCKPTPTNTPTATATESPTPSPSPTATATATYTPSPSPTATNTPSPSPTATASPSPSPTVTPTVSPSPSPTPSATPTESPTPSPTPSPTATATVTPTVPTPTCLVVRKINEQDLGIPNWPMTVSNGSSTFAGLTDGLGNARFDVLPGHWTVSEAELEGWEPYPPFQSSVDVDVPTAEPGQCVVVLFKNRQTPEVRFGLFFPVMNNNPATPPPPPPPPPALCSLRALEVEYDGQKAVVPFEVLLSTGFDMGVVRKDHPVTIRTVDGLPVAEAYLSTADNYSRVHNNSPWVINTTSRGGTTVEVNIREAYWLSFIYYDEGVRCVSVVKVQYDPPEAAVASSFVFVDPQTGLEVELPVKPAFPQ